ncbi:MoxR-like ATPase [Geothermobacter ehrlichii]|uniref:MoxR-like ATPase n=1 Tax=Geothermobacter ehrlichii TaxID=213224 RepID=A0A5D3WL82_9BACT|nr:AAA family ATPase [Geothermobacter ehrlichii]TYO98273.1 MoxR-like ATPase [Geothermobacter ehrlichii]
MPESAHARLSRDDDRIAELRQAFRPALEEAGRIVIGQEELFEGLLIGLLCEGHVLIEGAPGLAKTLAARTFARLLDLEFRRIQFTPDLLPSDLTGTPVYHPPSGEFRTRKGPIFTQILLADEINRAPAKVQAALLEAMEERQTTLGDETHPLPRPFMVLATQNPLEHEGTYPLPEAQLDRFFLKLTLGYPPRQAEQAMLDTHAGGAVEPPQPMLGRTILRQAQKAVTDIHLSQQLSAWLLDLIAATRAPADHGLNNLQPLIAHGVSPRGSLCLARAARARAFMRGRSYVVPDDILAMACPVLRHRLIPSYEAEAEGITCDDILRRILAAIDPP